MQFERFWAQIPLLKKNFFSGDLNQSALTQLSMSETEASEGV